jgi:toxin-antitoxin system PIN domain toxin
VILTDVNVLVYAHRGDAPEHDRYRTWLDDQQEADEAFAVSDLVLSGFLRVVTHPRVFDPPTPLAIALDFADILRTHPNAVVVQPGPRHWQIFSSLCRAVDAKGNLVPDAYLAALAIETGSEWITTDRDYARFPSLRWRHPFAA